MPPNNPRNVENSGARQSGIRNIGETLNEAKPARVLYIPWIVRRPVFLVPMQSSPKMPLLLLLIIALSIGDCCRAADSLVGLWQSETPHRSSPGHTNTIDAFQAVEFSKDPSFKITDVLITDGKRWTNVPFTGTYTMIATNQANLKVTAHNIPPGSTPSTLKVSCSIIGNELELPSFTSSAVPEYKRYRRVK
jgi:hypothetical protein